MKHTGFVAKARLAVMIASLSLTSFVSAPRMGGQSSKPELQATLKAERGYYGDPRLELITFHLTNHSDRSLSTAENSWVLVIDGKLAPDPGGQLWMGPRPSGGYGTLAPGRDFEFGKALALSEYFPEPRKYTLFWRAAAFRSNTLIVIGGTAP